MKIGRFRGARARYLPLRESVWIAALTLAALLVRHPSAQARAKGIVADSCEGCHGSGADTPDLTVTADPATLSPGSSVTSIDLVRIHEAKRSDPGRRKVHRGRRPKSASADAQNARRLEALLALEADLWEQQMAAVAQDFVAGQFRSGSRVHSICDHTISLALSNAFA